MPKTQITHAVTVSAIIQLDETELAALDALAGYGDDAFLEMFYKHLGKHYMTPHEAGLRRLFANIRQVAPRALSDLHTARQLMRQNKEAKLVLPVATPKPARRWWKFWG